MEQHLFIDSKIFGGSFFEKDAFFGAGIPGTLLGGGNDGGGGGKNNFKIER